MSGGVDVLCRVGDTEPRIASLNLAGADEVSVTVAFRLEDSAVSLTFTAERFLAFVEQLWRYAQAMPGKPSEPRIQRRWDFPGGLTRMESVMDKITQPQAISGRRLSMVESEPPLNTEARAIRTGLFFIEEVTGRKLAVYMCSEQQDGGGWLVDESDDEPDLENRNCSSRNHGTEERHEIISYRGDPRPMAESRWAAWRYRVDFERGTGRRFSR